MADDADAIASAILATMQTAWNAGDAVAFGAAFTPDADFVDVRGDYRTSRAAVVTGHQAILDSAYKGSAIEYVLMAARRLATNVVLAHSTARLNVPSGPLTGEHRATQTLVLAESGGAWQVTAFQNTLSTG